MRHLYIIYKLGIINIVDEIKRSHANICQARKRLITLYVFIHLYPFFMSIWMIISLNSSSFDYTNIVNLVYIWIGQVKMGRVFPIWINQTNIYGVQNLHYFFSNSKIFESEKSHFSNKFTKNNEIKYLKKIWPIFNTTHSFEVSTINWYQHKVSAVFYHLRPYSLATVRAHTVLGSIENSYEKNFPNAK